ncbi:mercury methylation ferredoxin HgcB [Candidatus Bipolaricaulota bacterium]
MLSLSTVNTLHYDEERCIGCGLCVAVCPHGVFAVRNGRAEAIRPDACMECGACQLNCAAEAIQVESGVGCAAAMIAAALRGKKDVNCGCGGGS